MTINDILAITKTILDNANLTEKEYLSLKEVVSHFNDKIINSNLKNKGKFDTLKVIKRILKSAVKTIPNKLCSSERENEGIYTDGHRLIKTKNYNLLDQYYDLDKFNTEYRMDVESIIESAKNYKHTITLPVLSALKNSLKTFKAEQKMKNGKAPKTIGYVLKTSNGEKVMFNAEYLIDFIEGGNYKTATYNNAISPIYSNENNVKSILLPMRMKEDYIEDTFVNLDAF